MSLEEMISAYYFPLIGIDAYEHKPQFIASVRAAVKDGAFSGLITEYNTLKAFVLAKLSAQPNTRASLQNFNRLRFHIQTELKNIQGYPTFEYVNI